MDLIIIYADDIQIYGPKSSLLSTAAATTATVYPGVPSVSAAEYIPTAGETTTTTPSSRPSDLPAINGAGSPTTDTPRLATDPVPAVPDAVLTFSISVRTATIASSIYYISTALYLISNSIPTGSISRTTAVSAGFPVSFSIASLLRSPDFFYLPDSRCSPY
jgi:hypothetical protein